MCLRKAYIQPDAEILSIRSIEDFLALSPNNPLDPDDGDENDDNGMGGSSGDISPDRPGIW